MIPGVSCSSCAFFSPPHSQSRFTGQSIKGQCRRHAPMLGAGDKGPITIWPLVHEGQWCGEHAGVDADA